MSEKKNISKKELRRRKRKRALMIKTGILCVLLVIFGIGIWALAGGTEKIQQKAQEKEDQKTAEVDGSVSSDSTGSAEAPTTKAQIMAEADALAQTYDYDGAIEKLQSVEGAATDADIITKVAEYTSTRDACVRVNVNKVTHIFYHSLVVDPQKAFYQDNAQTAGFCQWMTTVDEFNAITQQMYDRGYVMVSINDLVKKTKEPYTFAFRIPGWCASYEKEIPKGAEVEEKDGYLYVTKVWAKGETIRLNFPMEIQFLASNPLVREDAGRVAVKRGPVVYCMEEADNGKNLHLTKLCVNGEKTAEAADELGEHFVRVTAEGRRMKLGDAEKQPLYHLYQKEEEEKTKLKLIPYYMWNNRGEGEMQVWIRACE